MKDKRKVKPKVGDLYNYWKILEICEGNKVKCLCIGCDSTVKEILFSSIRYNQTKSCGCMKNYLRKQTHLKKYGVEHASQKQTTIAKVLQTKKTKCSSKRSQIQVGDQFNYLTVTETNTGYQRYVQCRCICGVTKLYDYVGLLNNTKSCGCKSSPGFYKNGIHYSQTIEAKKQREKFWLTYKNTEEYFEREKKRNKTLKEKYGSEITSTAQVPEIRRKQKETLLKRYGVSSPLQNPQILEKVKQTNLERYGVDNCRKNPFIKKKIREVHIENGNILTLSSGRTLKDVCEENKVLWNHAYAVYHQYGEEAFLEYCKNYNGKKITDIESLMISLLQKDFDIKKYDKQPREFKLNRRPDFRLEKKQKILYVNTDNFLDHCGNGRRNVKKEYHKELREQFNNHGIDIFQFRQDELRDKPEVVKSIIYNYFGLSRMIYARKCKIDQVNSVQTKIFLDQNHLMKSLKVKSYGLYFENQLVAVMSVKKKKQGIDITRFCTKIFTNVVGGFSKLLTHIIKQYQPKFIQSYLDLRYSTGKSYQKLDFNLENVTLSWKWTDLNKTYNRLKCRANMDERKLSQAEHAKELGWFKIYDAGQAKYVKELRE